MKIKITILLLVCSLNLLGQKADTTKKYEFYKPEYYLYKAGNITDLKIGFIAVGIIASGFILKDPKINYTIKAAAPIAILGGSLIFDMFIAQNLKNAALSIAERRGNVLTITSKGLSWCYTF
jgi:hypothetical protein